MYNFTSDEKGFSLVEIIVVVSIVGILAGISAPSFLNWRRHQIMTDATNEISGDLRSVADDARRWGASCSIILNRYVDGGKPIGIDCLADGSQSPLRFVQGKLDAISHCLARELRHFGQIYLVETWSQLSAMYLTH